MKAIYTELFWLDASERAIKTAAQICLVLIAGNNVTIWSLDWSQVLSAVLLGVLSSLLTSIVSGATGGNSASLLIDAKKPTKND